MPGCTRCIFGNRRRSLTALLNWCDIPVRRSGEVGYGSVLKPVTGRVGATSRAGSEGRRWDVGAVSGGVGDGRRGDDDDGGRIGGAVNCDGSEASDDGEWPWCSLGGVNDGVALEGADEHAMGLRGMLVSGLTGAGADDGPVAIVPIGNPPNIGADRCGGEDGGEPIRNVPGIGFPFPSPDLVWCVAIQSAPLIRWSGLSEMVLETVAF